MPLNPPLKPTMCFSDNNSEDHRFREASEKLAALQLNYLMYERFRIFKQRLDMWSAEIF